VLTRAPLFAPLDRSGSGPLPIGRSTSSAKAEMIGANKNNKLTLRLKIIRNGGYLKVVNPEHDFKCTPGIKRPLHLLKNHLL
jgi:hypothetical protein